MSLFASVTGCEVRLVRNGYERVAVETVRSNVGAPSERTPPAHVASICRTYDCLFSYCCILSCSLLTFSPYRGRASIDYFAAGNAVRAVMPH